LAQTLAQTNGDPAPGVIPAEVFHDATELVFPDGIRLERFARFGEDRFCQTTPNLRKLVINDSGTVLPGGYFKNLQVKEITVPYEVITRSVNLFRGSTAKRVKITNGGGGNADFSFGQFMECMNLESVEIENGVSAVPDSCFYKCEKLKRVEIPDSVTVINKGAFSDCVSLLDAGLPPNVRTIGDVAYRGCDSLSEVSIPAGADVGSHAFCNCQNLERVFVDGKVGDNAFAECPNLRRVEFGPNARDIGGQAFANCKGLKTVSLPEGLERVRKEAFYGAGLVTAKVACGETCFTRDWPSSEPFRNCNDMQSVYVANDFEGDKYRLVRLFGLRSVQEKVSIVKEGDWSWAPGCALADAGIAPGFMADGKLMLVDFGEKGLDQGTADLLAGAIAKAGDDIGVVFIGTDNTVLKALSDLSDVKKLLIYPPKKDASKAV
jgi:hypothetical protein